MQTLYVFAFSQNTWSQNNESKASSFVFILFFYEESFSHLPTHMFFISKKLTVKLLLFDLQSEHINFSSALWKPEGIGTTLRNGCSLYSSCGFFQDKKISLDLLFVKIFSSLRVAVILAFYLFWMLKSHWQREDV